MKKLLILATTLTALVLALGACGSTDSTSSTSTSSHNEQDVTFAQDMVPHHAQAIEMARMAATNAHSTQVKRLAAAIEAAQGPEIEQMTRWLRAWGEKQPSGSMTGMRGGMSGMMSDTSMHRLDRSTGRSFDRRWLHSMIGHHKGAVAMSEREIADGRSKEAIALAKTIKAAQTRELATMTALLAS